MRGVAQTVYGNLNWSTVIQGVTHELLVVREWAVSQGKMFGPEDSGPCGASAIASAPARRTTSA